MKKNKRFELVCSQEHKAKLEEKARELGVSLGSYLIFCGLNAKINIQIGVDPWVKHLESAKKMMDDNLLSRVEFEDIKHHILDGQGAKILLRQKKLEEER